MSLTKSFWNAVSWVARATLVPWNRRIVTIHDRIQPIHVHCNVVPQTDDQDHAAVQSLPHCCHATFLSKRVAVAKRSLLRTALLIRLGIVTSTCGVRRVGN